MEEKVFGYLQYDESGEALLCTYDNAYRAMQMDVRVYRMRAGEERSFCRNGEEIAVLLLSGEAVLTWEGGSERVQRKDVFTDGPYALHVCGGQRIGVRAETDTEILAACTRNQMAFAPKLYRPEDAPYKAFAKGKFGGTANRQVNTLFDKDTAPWSNMVLGETLTARGNWSSYLPHRHPQPELYYFRFDHPDGFGASFVGDEVFKSTDGSFAAIPGGWVHPQSAAPGFRMYTCWLIRHLDGDPWLQGSRFDDERYLWMMDTEFD